MNGQRVMWLDRTGPASASSRFDWNDVTARKQRPRKLQGCAVVCLQLTARTGSPGNSYIFRPRSMVPI